MVVERGLAVRLVDDTRLRGVESLMLGPCGVGNLLTRYPAPRWGVSACLCSKRVVVSNLTCEIDAIWRGREYTARQVVDKVTQSCLCNAMIASLGYHLKSQSENHVDTAQGKIRS